MIQDPQSFWNNIATRKEWRSYILPRENDSDFDSEGFVEAQRLFYFFDKNSLVVDYGCGIGRVLQYVAERVGFVVGLDICDGFLERARAANYGDNVAFFQSDEFHDENVADFVYSLMVLQHNDEPNREKIMSRIHGILKSGKMAIVSFPHFDSIYYKENDFIHKFTKGEVETFGRAFSSYWIIEGNLAGYERQYDGVNEYFLIATK
jgi:SAM-dependent methyltransferase